MVDSVDACWELRASGDDDLNAVALEYGGFCWDNWGSRHTDGREKLDDLDCTQGIDTDGNRLGNLNTVAVYKSNEAYVNITSLATAALDRGGVFCQCSRGWYRR